MIKIYGVVPTRTARVLWMLEEVGQPYELVEVTPRTEQVDTPEYRAVNPNGRVPALVDGDTVLWESMAINLYLAEKYGDAMTPATVEGRGLAYQWSFWGMTEAEGHLMTALFNRAGLPERDVEKSERAVAALQKPLGVLNGALDGRPYLLGDDFCVADLNLAAIFSWAKLARLDFSDYPNAGTWLNACLARDGWRKFFPSKAK